MPDASINIGKQYKFTRLDTSKSVTMKRDADPPTITQGSGRWNEVTRPRRTSFVTYNGSDLYRMDVPILFDGWDTGRSMEDAISILNQMCQSPGDYTPPPTVDIEGAVPVKGGKWVLDPMPTWGTQVIWHPDGYRLRQDCVVHLLEFVEADNLSIKPPATNQIYHVKAGDTLKSISKQFYGTPKFWSVIKNANKIRDVKKLPKTLRIPQIVGK